MIEHGYRHAPGEIELEGAADGDAIVVRLRDAAPPFDPRSVPEPRLDLPLAQRPFGGMGDPPRPDPDGRDSTTVSCREAATR